MNTQDPTLDPLTRIANALEQLVELQEIEPDDVEPSEEGSSIIRPGAGTASGRVWELSDRFHAALGYEPARKAIVAQAVAEGINAGTAATQFFRWRKAQGPKIKPS